ncbi:MAG: ATP phosphoribosyltransferase [Gammaproteobacteria bacterium]|nr:ATP phosphoribosyltransferase [Gammaproteobacteria bacterium]MCY4219961.1 ATP phosphoribosyltransferase [Gammaproteobacteria bacterium]MCY4274063.1 ATP phosphoribosyltransferase [Gammaproteobacteria bacterium]
MTQKLKLGIPKGSLQVATVDLFSQAGWIINPRSRNYFPSINDDEISCSLVRAQEMGSYITNGVLDAGLTGQDWLAETNSDVEIISHLIYSKSSDQPCRWVLVVKQNSEIQSVQDLEGKRIATELVNFTRQFLTERSINAAVDFSWGATEAKVVEGLADAAVEITETGSTIRAHGLRILCDLMETHTVFAANKLALEVPWKRKKIKQISMLLVSALSARERVLLKMNVPKERITDIVNKLPSLHAPTINHLHDGKWLAIETVVHKEEVRTLIPVLKSSGAEGILEISLHKMVP